MMELDEWWLRLSLIPSLCPDQLALLAESLYAIQGTSQTKKLRQVGLSEEQCRSFLQPDCQRLTNAQHWLSKPLHRLLTWQHPEYPECLRHLIDPPPLLFIAGDSALLQMPQCALVGSRRATSYGIQWAEHFASELAISGLVITSGLAVGIDGFCHRAALEVGGKTIAVLGNGLQTPYPRCHHPLAERILEQGGILVSEYSPDTPPKPFHFPRRNRLISGLSLGVLVVEASVRSGSLITARHALDQGKDIFALPGDLDRSNSQGCHQLIRQGACLVTKPAEVLEVLKGSLHWLTVPAIRITATSEKNSTQIRGKSPPYPELLAHIKNETTSIDVIVQQTGKSLSEALHQLLEMELTGWITAVSGGYVQRKRETSCLKPE